MYYATKSELAFTLMFVSIFLLLPQSTHAYLDPGTGSYLLQLLAGGLVGGLYVMKTWRHAILGKTKRFFKKPSGKSPE